MVFRPAVLPTSRLLILAAAAMLVFSACSDDNTPNTTPIDQPPRQETPPDGATSFVSADGRAGSDSLNDQDAAPSADRGDDGFAGEGGGERTVEEGDIYRVLSGDLILNLNAYRGLQIIDFGDVENPEIIGRLQATGSPVELYVYGDHALVLMNNWRGYYGSRDDVNVETREGGLALSVDISDPTAPEIVDQAYIPGYIQTSRLTRGGGQAALYVATSQYDYYETSDGDWTWETHTFVQSFDVSTGDLVKRSLLDLGGYVADIQATPEALIVARWDWSSENQGSRVSLLDISDPSGRMVEGDEVVAAGRVENQFNMDLYDGVLRIVSGATWSGTRTNHVQTFDATDVENLEPIDHKTFGDGENLYATLFVGYKAFFVTYRQIDPFHAFSIDADGTITEKSEFIVSGWNDFFRAVLDETRLIGIGTNDEGSRTMSVSLYDITDLSNPHPLMARADVEADYSWSEASWDHRAFSVIEDAVAIDGPNGEEETGLVLLPFSGWSDERDQYTAAVQIFTFSEESLTRRGMMVHGTQVRRSFQADGDLTANLSEAELSLFDTSDPDEPVELGRVDLAPNYTDVLIYGDYYARVRNSRDYYYYWWGGNSDLPPATVELVPRADHPDMGEAVASFEIPSDATVYQTGNMLVSVTMHYVDTTEWPYTYESTIDVWDLSDPTSPLHAGTITTDKLRPSYGGYYGYGGRGYLDGDCFNCDIAYPWYQYSTGRDTQPITDGLAFLQRHDERELLGTEQTCSIYPVEDYSCWDAEAPSEGCHYYTGSLYCRNLIGEEPYCTGEILECSYVVGEDSEWDCNPIDPNTIETSENCWEYERYRYWQRFSLEVLDLSDTSAMALADSIDLGDEGEGVSMLVDKSSAWISLREPYEISGDSRPYMRYFIQEIDLSDPSTAVLNDPINVPGELFAIDDDDIYTRDTLWGESIVETGIARLQLYNGLAYLQAMIRFEDEVVSSIALDGAGNLIVSHQLSWQIGRELEDDHWWVQKMSVLDTEDFEELALVEVDDWATLRDAREGRALFQVPGGLLVFNLDNPSTPFPQAYFPTLGWPSQVKVDGDEILFAAGRYGIYTFDLDSFNLLLPIF